MFTCKVKTRQNKKAACAFKSPLTKYWPLSCRQMSTSSLVSIRLGRWPTTQWPLSSRSQGQGALSSRRQEPGGWRQGATRTRLLTLWRTRRGSWWRWVSTWTVWTRQRSPTGTWWHPVARWPYLPIQGPCTRAAVYLPSVATSRPQHTQLQFTQRHGWVLTTWL